MKSITTPVIALAAGFGLAACGGTSHPAVSKPVPTQSHQYTDPYSAPNPSASPTPSPVIAECSSGGLVAQIQSQLNASQGALDDWNIMTEINAHTWSPALQAAAAKLSSGMSATDGPVAGITRADAAQVQANSAINDSTSRFIQADLSALTNLCS